MMQKAFYFVVEENATQPAAMKRKTATVDESFGEPNFNFGKEIGQHGHAVKGQD